LTGSNRYSTKITKEVDCIEH